MAAVEMAQLKKGFLLHGLPCADVVGAVGLSPGGLGECSLQLLEVGRKWRKVSFGAEHGGTEAEGLVAGKGVDDVLEVDS